MEREQARRIIEALLYMTDHALTLQEISEVLEQKSITPEHIREMIDEISTRYESYASPLRIVEVAGGFQVATRQEMSSWIRKLYKERLTVRLSPSSLETLSIIAYKQPITRGEIEQIRGVEATGVMETLLERRLVKVVGRKETIGRPLLYGTTIEFLRHFGLRHLSELPDLSTLQVPSAPAADQPELPISIDDSAAAEEPATVSTAVLEESPENQPQPPTEETPPDIKPGLN